MRFVINGEMDARQARMVFALWQNGEVNRNKINIFNHIRKLKLKRSEEEGEQE